MSPIDPRELKKSGRTYVDVIETDRLCGKCRYNLRGLPTNGRCPECGHPIRGGGRSGHRRFSDNLAEAPLFYLKSLAVGAWMVALGGVGTAVMLKLAEVYQRQDCAIAAGFTAVLWWTGVFIVTGPRAFGDNTLRDEALDGPHLRWINRVANLALIGVAAAWVLAFRAPFGSRLEEYAQVGARVLSLVGVAGFVTLGLQMASMADWAGDSHLAERFRTTAWIMGAGIVLTLFSFVTRAVPGLLSGLVGWFALAITIVAGIAQLYFAWALIQLAGMATWAIHNNVTAGASERRLMTARERREQEMAERTAIAIALQDAGPPPTLGADGRAQTAFESNRLEQHGGGNPYDVEPDPPAAPAQPR